jgi:flagellar protein FlaI
VVSIEDTREIMLDHDNWIASLVPLTSGASTAQRDITMFDLLKAAMRQRPEYILLGEVRGVEAQTLFQAMNSGHTTYSTLHGGDVAMAIRRLENEPLNVPKATIETLDIVLCQASMFRNKKQVRRCKEITEIVGLTDKGELEINTVYQYNYEKDAPSFSGSSRVYASIAEKTGMNMTTMGEDLRRRTAILQAMLDQDIRDYRDFARIVWLFLSRPKYVMANIADLTQILPGKCKLHETLANRPVSRDEYPEMVDGPAESDAAYGRGSSVSDRGDASGRVCYIPEPSANADDSDLEVPSSAAAPLAVSGEQPSIADSAPVLETPADLSPEEAEPAAEMPAEPYSYEEEPEAEIPAEPSPDEVEPEPVEEPSLYESEPEAASEDYFFDIHAPLQSEEEIFGPSEPEPDPLFEVEADRELTSFDLYADEQTSGSPPEKKQP